MNDNKPGLEGKLAELTAKGAECVGPLSELDNRFCVAGYCAAQDCRTAGCCLGRRDIDA